jgi:hypothetical protein
VTAHNFQGRTQDGLPQSYISRCSCGWISQAAYKTEQEARNAWWTTHLTTTTSPPHDHDDVLRQVWACAFAAQWVSEGERPHDSSCREVADDAVEAARRVLAGREVLR